MFRFSRSKSKVPSLHLQAAGLEAEAARATLAAHLQKWTPAGAAHTVEVTLPGRACPLMMLPWTQAMAGPEAGREAFVRERFAAVHGQRVRGWRFAFDDAPFGQPRLAFAAPAAAIDAVAAACRDNAVADWVIRPRIVSELRSLTRATGLFALAEDDFVSVCMLHRGRIVQAQGEPWLASAGGSIEAICARFKLRHPQFADCGPATLIEAGRNGN